MRIVIGSTNPVKIDAVKESIQDYDFLADAEVIGMEVLSDVSEQPKSIEETVNGAINRAKNAFHNCNYSVGIESGLMKVPNTKTGYMDATVCVIYDGKHFHMGLSSAFEYPKEMTRLVFDEELDIDQAARKTGITDSHDIGNSEGVIGILTKGRLPRKDYTKQAVITALIHLENPHLF